METDPSTTLFWLFARWRRLTNETAVNCINLLSIARKNYLGGNVRKDKLKVDTNEWSVCTIIN